jgi:hypothetical protein
MADENTQELNGAGENESFEEFVRRQFALIFRRLDHLEIDVVDRFLQLSQQIRDLDARVEGEFKDLDAKVVRVEKRVKDLDYKVGPFIREQIDLRRDVDELLEAAELK